MICRNSKWVASREKECAIDIVILSGKATQVYIVGFSVHLGDSKEIKSTEESEVMSLFVVTRGRRAVNPLYRVEIFLSHPPRTPTDRALM